MQVLVPGADGRTYYRAKSLKTKTAGKVYNGKPLPVFTIRTETEAKTNPFITVFESYKGASGNSVDHIEVAKVKESGEFTAFTVFNKDGSYQEIFQSVNPGKEYSAKNGSITGYFGIAGFKDKKLTALYLGKGTAITNSGYSLKSMTPNGSTNLIIEGKTIKVSCNQSVEVGVPLTEVKKVSLKTGEKITSLKTTRSGKQLLFEVPAITDGEVILN